VNFLAEL